MRRLLIILIVFTGNFGYTQNSYEYLQGDINCRINSNGLIAIDVNTLNPSSSFQETTNHFLQQAGLWITAKSNAGLHTSIQTLKTIGQYDFSYGPLDTILSQPDTVGWNHVWKVSASEIYKHKKAYDNIDYEIPESILHWPAAHEGANFIEYLAPFADFNDNSKYDPENGDYPYIKGDEAIYVVCNDNFAEHKVSFGAPLGLEIHLMAYRYDDVPETIFLEYYLINRLSMNYTDVNVGLFLRGELGNSSDNFAGTLVDEQTVLLYNGDDYDDGHFGDKLPYVYARIFNKLLNGSAVMEWNGSGIRALPDSAQQFDNILHGKWAKGQNRTYGANADQPGTAYPFMYVFDSDPSVNNWSEPLANNWPGARNILGYTSFETLDSGSFIKLNACLGFGFFNNNEKAEEVVSLKSNAASSKFQQTNNVRLTEKLNIAVKPNPISDFFVINTEIPGEYELKLVNSQGLTVYDENIYVNGEFRCNILLPSGIYWLELNKNGRMFNKLLIVQP